MYQRRVRPYQFGLPPIAPTQNSAYQQAPGSTSQTQGDRQQSQMPNIPTGLLEQMFKPAPYSMASELPTGAGLMDSYIAGMGPADAYAGAMEGIAPDLGFSTPYLNAYGTEAASLMPSSEAFSLGGAGTDFGMGVGAGSAAGEAALDAGASGAAASGAAEGGTAAGGAATGAMAAIPVWGWAALAAPLAAGLLNLF